MATSKNAKLLFEAGRTLNAYEAFTNSGDNTIFTGSSAVFSGKSGYEPDVRPNGVVSGRNMLSPSATNNVVSVAAFTAYVAGALVTVSATTATAVRPATDVAKICSVTVDSAGAIDVVEGTDGSTASFSAVRGAAGGPPSIPLAAVEIGQVKLTSSTAALIASSEISQIIGTSCERYDYPAWNVNNIGKGQKALTSAEENAHVTFESALPVIHGASAGSAATATKAVYAQYYSPVPVEASSAYDFVPVERTHSISSQDVYGNKSVGSVSSSFAQGGFVALLNDGVTDSLKGEQDEVVTVWMYPDKNKPAYTLTQGVLGIKTTYPTGSQNKATCTLSADSITANFAS